MVKIWIFKIFQMVMKNLEVDLEFKKNLKSHKNVYS